MAKVPAVKEIRTLADLTTDPANARAHTPRNIGMIADSLQEVGFARSIVIDEGGVILAGNGVAEAAGQVGMEAVRVVEADGDELIVVRRANLTPAQKTRLALFDNRATDLSSFDPAVLATLDPPLLEGLWRPEELAELLATIPPDVVPGGGGDEFDTTPQEGPTRCQPGDLWAIGPHRLLVGDSTDPAAVARLMDGKTAETTLTDPPYNVGIDYGPQTNDEQTRAAYTAFSRAWFAACPPSFLVFTPGMVNLAMWYAIQPPKWVCSWRKVNQCSHSGLGGFNTWEPLLCYGKPPLKVGHDSWDIPVRQEMDRADPEHPVAKTVEAWSAFVEAFSTGGALIYDPFLGSGTGIISAHRTGRVCYGCELEPKYADVCIRRAEAEGIAPITRLAPGAPDA